MNRPAPHTTSTARTTSTSGTPVDSTTLASPVGELVIGVTSRGVRFVLWPGEHRSLRLDVGVAGGPAREAASDDGAGARARLLERTVEQLREYVAGERTEFDVPLDPIGTPFQRSVWDVLRTIPYASTMTYGEQARALGDPNKARTVGAANGRNPIGIIVPCHRVVGRDGSLTGFAGGTAVKGWLIDHERRVAAGR